MGLLITIFLIVCYVRYRKPRRLPDGSGWRMLDRGDGPVRLVVAAFLLFWGTELAWIIYHAPATVHDTSAQKIFWAHAGSVVGWLALIYFEGRRLLELAFALPAELIVPEWPLKSGTPVEITYRRRMLLGRPAGDVNAKLELWSLGDPSDGPIFRHRCVRETRVLTDGEASYENGLLTATWRFWVPFDIGDPRRVVADLVHDAFTGYSNGLEWRLHVDIPLAGLGKVDSTFPLKVAVDPGRSQFAPEAVGWDPRRRA